MKLGDVLELGWEALRRLGGAVAEMLQPPSVLAPLLRRSWLGLPGGMAAGCRRVLEPPRAEPPSPSEAAAPSPATPTAPAAHPLAVVTQPATPARAAGTRTTGLPRVPPSVPPVVPRAPAGVAAPPRPTFPARPTAPPGADHVGLLPRDPYWLFAFWEIRSRTRVEALRQLGAEAEGACAVLRVYARAGTPEEGVCFDVELSPGADRWYLQVPHDDAAYAVEVGLRTVSGRYLAFGRSDVARTPPARPSEQVVAEWYTAPPPPPAEPTVVAEVVAPEPAPPPPLPEPPVEPVATPAPGAEAAGAEAAVGKAVVGKAVVGKAAVGEAAVGEAAPPLPAPPGPPTVDTAALLAPGEPRSSEALAAR